MFPAIANCFVRNVFASNSSGRDVFSNWLIEKNIVYLLRNAWWSETKSWYKVK